MLPNLDFLTFLDQYNAFATVFVSMVCVENGLFTYWSRKESFDDIESIDEVMFVIFLLAWIIVQIIFVIYARKLYATEQKKLYMGTPQLLQANMMYKGGSKRSGETASYFVNKSDIDQENLYQKLRNLEWVTLAGKPR